MIFKPSYPGKLRCIFPLLISFVFNMPDGSAQPVFAAKEALLTTPRQYVVFFNPMAPVLDGKIEDAVWKNAAWTEYFIDIEADKKPAPA